jgi:hypothetical protein
VASHQIARPRGQSTIALRSHTLPITRVDPLRNLPLAPTSEHQKGSDHNKIHKQDICIIYSHPHVSHNNTAQPKQPSLTHPEDVVPRLDVSFPLVRAQHLPMDLDVQFSRIPTPALSAVESTLDPVA